jgi:hypothetical protein
MKKTFKDRMIRSPTGQTIRTASFERVVREAEIKKVACIRIISRELGRKES